MSDINTAEPLAKPQSNAALMGKREWALHFAKLGMPIHRLVHTLPDGNCSCGSKLNADGKLIIPDREAKCSPGKHPIPGVSWLANRTTDAATIEQWCKDEPAMNYCVSSGNGFTIIDPDMKNGKNGIREIAKDLDISDWSVSQQMARQWRLMRRTMRPPISTPESPSQRICSVSFSVSKRLKN